MLQQMQNIQIQDVQWENEYEQKQELFNEQVQRSSAKNIEIESLHTIKEGNDIDTKPGKRSRRKQRVRGQRKMDRGEQNVLPTGAPQTAWAEKQISPTVPVTPPSIPVYPPFPMPYYAPTGYGYSTMWPSYPPWNYRGNDASTAGPLPGPHAIPITKCGLPPEASTTN